PGLLLHGRMLVWRLNSWRSPTMGEKYVNPLPLSSGINSSFALSCGLLVMAPKRAHVVSFSAFTVRSGSALPSLHQNSQPISQGTYSASSFRRSSTRRAASITSWPTPSPGIHAILYLDIGLRFYRRVHDSQERAPDYRGLCGFKRMSKIIRAFAALCLCGSHRAKPRCHEIFGAARHDQFLRRGTERRKSE